MLSTIVTLMTAASAFQPVVTQHLTSPSGHLTFEQGALSEPLTGDLSIAIPAWAAGNRETLGLPPATALVHDHAFGTRWGASFHLVQKVEGLPVYGAKLVVTVDRSARITQLASSLVHSTTVADGWLVNETAALKTAAKSVTMPLLLGDGNTPSAQAKRMFFEVGDELHAGYLIHVASLSPADNWFVAVDAITGQTIFAQNRVYHSSLDANVYPISPGGLDAGVGKTATQIGTLTRPDGGSLIADTCEIFMPEDGGFATVPNDGGFLCGEQITQYNCCPREGCKADAGTKHLSGRTNFTVAGFTLNVAYDVGVCDRIRRASPLTGESGTYRYQPVDPPANQSTVNIDDPTGSDEFAEVHSFYHVNRVYDWVRGLSNTAQGIFTTHQPAIAAFQMRDERVSGRKPAIWANVMFPNFTELQNSVGGQIPGCLTTPPCHASSSTFTRIDNAQFMPRESFSQLPLPGFDTGVDTLMIFQGNSADGAYDSTVIQHEFGHGVVYATADLSLGALAIDSRSVNNEGGALHEGFADYIAAAFNNEPGIGPYFGPRATAGTQVPGVAQEAFLRDLDNNLSCPGVLWGEVHQDSEHVSAALWKARTTLFQGTDQGHTFDAAFYGMLVSISPNADFAMVAAAMSARAKDAFGGTADAQMNQIFTDKGVIGCSKVLDMTGQPNRPYYGIAQAEGLANNTMIPGAIQLKIPTPNGATRVHVSAQLPAGGFGQQAAVVNALVRVGSPITFTKTSTTLTNDSQKSVQLAAGSGTASVANIDVASFCGAGSAVYVTLASAGGATAQDVAVSVDVPANCNLVGVDAGTDAGRPDAGRVDSGTPDAGGTDGGSHQTQNLPGVGEGNITSKEAAKTGCGCGAVDVTPVMAIALVMLSRLRRRNR